MYLCCDEFFTRLYFNVLLNRKPEVFFGHYMEQSSLGSTKQKTMKKITSRLLEIGGMLEKKGMATILAYIFPDFMRFSILDQSLNNSV